jgi:hypothetical protein
LSKIAYNYTKIKIKNNMNQTNKTLIVLVVMLLAGISAFYVYQKPIQEVQDVVFDYKNISYQIDGKTVLLKNGLSEVIIPDSSSKSTTRYFGNEVKADINGDGLEDVAFLLTQDNGGSGTFYYVVVAIKNGETYTGTNAIFLGDRIAPQTTEFKEGMLIVNYADRKIDEPMTTEPSVGVSRYFKIEGGKLIEVIS